MNVNPHLQYLQGQHQQQNQHQQKTQQQHSPSQSRQSPQMSQLSMQQQRQLQQQRQQLINQHHQQQQQQQQPQQQQQQNQQQPHSTGNTLLATLNAGIDGGQKTVNSPGPNALNYSQNGNPLLSIQSQIPQHRFNNQPQPHSQQQQHSQQQHLMAQSLSQQSQHQVPIIKEVWNYNLEYEFAHLRKFISDKTAAVFISIHQEIPGIVARPVGTFKSSSDYHFQTLRSNSDLLNLIQLSLCVIQIKNNEISNSFIWQFNFHYDLSEQMFNEEHLSMLSSTSQISFASHANQGIPQLAFAELMMESGLLLDSSINWLSYHSGYDLGFLVSLLTNDILPNDENEFFWWCSKFFPNFYDLKHIGNQLLSGGNKSSGTIGPTSNNESGNNNGGMANSDIEKGMSSNNKPSVEYLAEELHLLPISPVIRQFFASPSLGQFAGAHHTQQMTSTLHAYLLMECFKELFRQVNSELSVFQKYKGLLWGLGDVTEGVRSLESEKRPKQNS